MKVQPMNSHFMHQLIHIATAEFAAFLGRHLPAFGETWWKSYVEARLTFQQQRIVRERNFTKLEQLDFASLLRILDQNWYDLSGVVTLPREGRTWIKELQTVRNRWAHLSGEPVPSNDIYRDTDTLARALSMIDATPDSIKEVEIAKRDALSKISPESKATGSSANKQTGAIMPPETPVDSDDSSVASQASAMFSVGNLVALRTEPAIGMPITKVILGNPETRYQVFYNNRQITHYESQLEPFTPRKKPPFQNIEELQAFLTSLYLLSPSTENLYSLRSGRVQFVPYQYRPILKLIRADRPRLLIADEVGVGKTIEAGLIIKELRARMDISSVLVICPKALVSARKWVLEMKRFDEHFDSLDGPTLRHCLWETRLEGEWPNRYSKIIIPFSLFNSDLLSGKKGKGSWAEEGLLDLNPPPKFDLVIVDEAHHIRNADTYLHSAVRFFCDNAQAAVFLTATPVQLGSHDLFSLLNVLRPDLIIDQASFQEMAAPNRFINEAVSHCNAADDGWQIKARACLEQVAQTEWGRFFLREEPEFQKIYDRLAESQIDEVDRIHIIRSLEELYTFSSMVNRTRRRDIGEFATRQPQTLTIEFTPDQRRLHDDLLEAVSHILERTHRQQNVKFMMTTLRRQTASCLYGLSPFLGDLLAGKLDSLGPSEDPDREMVVDDEFLAEIKTDIEALIERAEGLDPHDPKIQKLVNILQEKSGMENNKALVFSTFRHTLAYIARHVADAGLRYGLIHGGVADKERSELRQRFALSKDAPEALDVLLSSEVGSEGLDFQFCNLLINYDLPWNPMRIEQRIGRIDRYGQQSESIAIVNFVTPGTVDADIYERCLMRIGVFHHSVGGSEEILGEITKEIYTIAESLTLTPEQRTERLRQLGANKLRQIQEEAMLEEKQAELFGLAVPNQSWHKKLTEAESFWLSPKALQHCVSVYLSAITNATTGFLLGDKPLKTLRLGENIRTRMLDDFHCLSRSADPVGRQWEKWLKGTDPLLPVTFDQKIAAAEPKTVYLNVLHPLVRQAAHHLQRHDSAQINLTAATMCVPPGVYHFALYQWSEVGLRNNDKLVVVTSDTKLDDIFMSLLEIAIESPIDISCGETEMLQLEKQHYNRWRAARADHMAENRNMVQHRERSLEVSHRARRKQLMDQINKAVDGKIHRMKKAELEHADTDYKRRAEELQTLADKADIHAILIMTGALEVTTKGDVS